MAPDNLNNPDPADRLYAGTWWVGAHTHFDWQRVRGDRRRDNPRSPASRRGSGGCNRASMTCCPMPSMNIGGHQVENGVYLHGTVELGAQPELGGGGGTAVKFPPFPRGSGRRRDPRPGRVRPDDRRSRAGRAAHAGPGHGPAYRRYPWPGRRRLVLPAGGGYRDRSALPSSCRKIAATRSRNRRHRLRGGP